MENLTRVVLADANEEFRAVLKEMPTAEQIKEMLASVGLDMQEFYDLYSAEKITEAIAYGKELKDRYTVLWMYYDLLGEAGEAK